MQAPRFASRLLAALLTVTWAALALALLASPATGGSRPLLALAALIPTLVSAAAIVWPVAPDGRAGWAVGWLGVSALLLALPFAILVGGPLAAGVAQPIRPSAGMVYAGLLAVLCTTAYAAHGWLEARGRRIQRVPPPDLSRLAHVRPGLIGLALTGLAAATGGFALAANDVSLAGVPPDCGGVTTAPFARVTIDARAAIDGRTIATASVSGERSGPDERWAGIAGGDSLDARAYEYALVGGRGLLRSGEGEWRSAGDGDDAATGHLDRRVASVLAEPGLPPPEDLGIDLVDGATARHCRMSVGGPHALRAVLPLGWLLGREPLDRGPALGVWRGDLDWWTFADGQLGRATVLVGGHPSDAWTGTGLRGMLRAEMRVVERDVPRTIDEPLT